MIFGSSRALHHYNPAIISNETKLSCFNMGYGGQNIYYHLALLKSTLKYHKPKIVVLDLITIDIEKTSPQWDVEKLGILAPFIHICPECKEAVMQRGGLERIKLI